MELRRRKDIRLKGYDYSAPRYYFVTICTHKRRCTLGSVGPATGGPCALTDLGCLVVAGLGNIPRVYPHIHVDRFCIMPNHVHAILVFGEPDGGPPVAGPTLGRVISGFKGFVARGAGEKVWQEDFYDHIIRSEPEYLDISRYLEENPLKWSEDEYFP